MSDVSEEVNINVTKLKKTDCVESDDVEHSMETGEINFNTSNVTNDENGKESSVNSGDEAINEDIFKQNKTTDFRENSQKSCDQNSNSDGNDKASENVNNESEDENLIPNKNNTNIEVAEIDPNDVDNTVEGSCNIINNAVNEEVSASNSEIECDPDVAPSSPIECDAEKTEVLDTEEKSDLVIPAVSNKSTADELSPNSPSDCDSEKISTKINGDNDSESRESINDLSNSCEDNASVKKKISLLDNSSLIESMDVDSNSLNSTDAATSTESMSMADLCSKEESASKIKLRSFASLCDSDEKEDVQKPSATSAEVSGLTVGDIVQHSNIVEHDQSGVLHLKITDVVGKEECITGISEDDTLSSLQITSVVSLTEPLSPEEEQDSNESQLKIASVGTVSDSTMSLLTAKDKPSQTVIIHKNRLVVGTTCIACRKQCVCKFRIYYKPPKPYIKFPYLCTEKCRDNFVRILPENHKVEKAIRFFERLCSMCDKTLGKKDMIHWQTREFCDKLCLADHIGEVARHCYECKTAVKVLFMGKYCVRFGSEVHQFCSNHCLESYKMKVDSCSYCQKNLEKVDDVVSEPPKKYCSLMCLRRYQRADIGQANYAIQNNCTVCIKSKVNQYEFLNNNESVLLCSNPCLSVYKYVNQVKAVNCCMCSRFVNAENFPNYFYTNNQLRVFCSESCLSVFVITHRRVVSCQYCKVKKYNFDMIQKGNTFFCSICCLNLSDSDRGKQVETVQIDSAANRTPDEEPILKICQFCSKNMPAQFHMVMSDSTLRSFCSYNCACKFKTNFGFQVSGVNVPIPKADTVVTTEKTTQVTKKTKNITTKPYSASKVSKVDFSAIAKILKEFEPPEMINKWTSCCPNKTTVASQCAPSTSNKGIQTDEDGSPPFVPVPFPTFVPMPMMMYSANVPIPLILPIPIPVPVFIPTTEKTTEDILKQMNKIQNEIPDDPIQAELLLLAKGQEAEMQQELESQITEEDLQTPQMVLEEPDEILTFVDNDEDLSLLDDSIHKFTCAVDGEPKRNKKKRRSYDDEDDDFPESKRQKSSDEMLNAAFGLSVWLDWVRKKNAELKSNVNSRLINEDLVQINSEAINECLSMFLIDLEESEDRVYEIDTIFYLLLGIQKVMFERGSTFCIFLEDRFDKFGSTFDQMITRYLNKQFSSDVLGFQMLNGSRITEDMLWQCRQLGAHTPYVLLNTLFYFSTKCFKLRTVEDHMALSFSQVIKQWRRACLVEGSYTRTTLLKYFPRQAHFDKTDLEMHENRVDPLKCPVKLYEFYLSKCPESVRSQQGLYYVYPETCCMPDSPVWFSTGALNATTIERMLHRVLLVKEIQESLYH